MSEIEQLKEAMAALESQRGALGNAVVDAALAPLRERLASLQGTAGEIEPELKYITVLFLDIAGSTRLTQGLDAEDIHDILDGALKQLSEVVEKHGGRVTRFMGDGFKSVFGIPSAREDDALRAVSCGLKLVEAARMYAVHLESRWGLTGFDVRVGINSGPVAIGGFSEAGDTVMGLTVNLGARMESAAPVGGVLISQNTYQHIRDNFTVEPKDPVAVKGFPELVPVYLVRGARHGSGQISQRRQLELGRELVGRDTELARLQTVFESAMNGPAVQLATISGEAGVGKSRLALDFMTWIERNSPATRILKGYANPGSANAPFGLLREIFTSGFGILDTDPVNIAREKLETNLATFFTDEAEMKTHFIGALLGLDFPESPHLPPQEPGATGTQGRQVQFRERALFYLMSFLSAFARQTPTFIYLDDIHWADAASLEAIERILADVSPVPLCLVCTARPEFFTENPGWGDAIGAGDSTKIELRPLTQEDSHALIAEIFPETGTVPGEVRELIAKTAEGNPYFVEELVKMLIDEGAINIDESLNTWQVTSENIKDLHIPVTLRSLLVARLDRLPGPERNLLQRSAVVGRRFWDRLLQAIGEDEQTPTVQLAGLVRRELIFPNEVSTFEGMDEFTFSHILLRDVAYETVLKRARKAYHARTAAWLIEITQSRGRSAEYAAVIADHFERAADRESAACWYLQAGERAKSQGAFKEARQFFDKALTYLPEVDLESRWQALLGRDEALGVLGESEARQVDDAALLALAGEMGDAERIVIAHLRMGYYASTLSDNDRAMQALEAARGAARDAGLRDREAEALGLITACLSRMGNTAKAGDAAANALAMAEHIEDDLTKARVLTNIGFYYLEAGDNARAVRIQLQVIDTLKGKGERYGEVINAMNLGYNYLMLGRFRQGREVLEETRLKAEMIGARMQGIYCSLNLGMAYWRLGELAAGIKVLEDCRPQLTKIGDTFGEAAGHSYQGLILEAQGEPQAALEHYNKARERLQRIGARGYASDALAGVARCALVEEDLEAAVINAGHVWDYLEEQGGQGMEFPILAYQTCAEIFQASGAVELEESAIRKGHAALLERGEKLSDKTLRKSFFENVPEHKAITTLRENSQNRPK